MLHRWAAPALVLALCALVPEQAAGQSQQSPGRKTAGALGQNYPNPFNPETKIPIHVGHSADHLVGQPDCGADEGKQHVVTLRIYNVLGVLVATPTLQASTGGGSAVSGPLNGLVLRCGDYVAFWNGHLLNTTREVPSGVYVYELIVDGQRSSRKMFVGK
jgi:hypothetical protein